MVDDIRRRTSIHVTHDQQASGVGETTSFKMPNEPAVRKEFAEPKPLTSIKREKALETLARIGKFAVGAPATAILVVIGIPWACAFSPAIPIATIMGAFSGREGFFTGFQVGMTIALAPLYAATKIVSWMEEKNKV